MLYTTKQNLGSINAYRPLMKSFIITIILTLFSLPALAQPFEADGHRGEMNLERLAERLELSDQQRTDIKAIMEAGKNAMEPTKIAMKDNRDSLEAVINSTNPDQGQIQSLAETQGQLMTESLLQRVATRLQVKDLLSEQQQIKMQAYKDAHHDMREARNHRRPPRMGRQ